MTWSADKSRPLPLAERVRSALALQPMTVAQLTECLSANHWLVRKEIAAMQTTGEVELFGMWRRQHLHALAHPQPQRQDTGHE